MHSQVYLQTYRHMHISHIKTCVQHTHTHTYTHGEKKKREEGREGEGRKRKCWKNYKAKTKKSKRIFKKTEENRNKNTAY